MGKRTTIALAAVAVAMLGFILLHERHTLSSKDMEGRHDRLLPEFVRDHVTRIEIARDDERVVLVHEREGEDDVLGEWRLVEPVEAAADENTVESLLGSLEWAHARRTIEDATDEDLERFGLQEPALQVWFTVKRERVPIRVGTEDPTEGGHYVRVGEANAVHVAGKDFTEALDHEAGHFRSKALFPSWEAGDARALTVHEGDDVRELSLREDRWWLAAPFEAWSDHPRVEAALDAVLGLDATRYVAEDPDEVDGHGMEQPSLEVRVRGGESDAEEDRWTAVLRVGDTCGSHDDELYARAGDGPLVCVRGEDLAALRTPAERLRQETLSKVREPELTFAQVEHGSRKLVLEEDEGTLKYRAGEAEGEADGSAVGDWLRSLQGATIATFEPLGAGDANRYGLSRPQATLTLKVREGGPDTVLYLGAQDPEGFWVRRGSEPFAVRVDATVAEAFEPSPVRFRSRALIAEPDEAARRVVVDRDGTTERIELQDGAWHVREPVQVLADGVGARGLVRRLANLEAIRFVAERPAALHGLSSPRWTVTLRFEGGASDSEDQAKQPREYVLRVGAPTEGGAFAQVGSDPAVFVLPQVVVDDLASPLVDRDLLATGRNDLRSIRIEQGRRTVELVREEDEWRQADGSAADRERTRRLVDRLGALRASGATAYGAAEREQGLEDPRAVVTVRRAEGSSEPQAYTFRIGATVGEGEAARTHVRKDDLAVGFVYPAEVMDTFVAYEP